MPWDGGRLCSISWVSVAERVVRIFWTFKVVLLSVKRCELREAVVGTGLIAPSVTLSLSPLPLSLSLRISVPTAFFGCFGLTFTYVSGFRW